MAAQPLASMQLTSLDGFIEELKRRGIAEARFSEWTQRRDVLESRKLRLTAWTVHIPCLHKLLLVARAKPRTER